MSLNLARRVFVNTRPVRRLALLLWGAGAVLLLADVWLFWSYFTASAEKRGRLAALETEAAEERRLIAGLETELRRFDLARQNEEVAFVNRRIAERTFGWSRLFDDLAEVLPWDVRISGLSPLSLAGESRSGRRASAAPKSASR
jgi:Tfp pilus assembly protein PilN